MSGDTDTNARGDDHIVAMLNVSYRKLTYLLRDYPDDKETAKLLEDINSFLERRES